MGWCPNKVFLSAGAARNWPFAYHQIGVGPIALRFENVYFHTEELTFL